MNQFGVTSPCAKIAAHFNVPQNWVDALMEFKLVENGIRTRNNWPTHVHHYWGAGGKTITAGIPQETIYAIHAALKQVCDDILELAKGK